VIREHLRQILRFSFVSIITIARWIVFRLNVLRWIVHKLLSSTCAQTLGGGQKLANRSQPFPDQSSPNLGTCREVPVDWPISFGLLISCSVAEIFSVEVRSRSLKRFLLPALEGKCRKSSDQFFSNSSHKWYVSKCGWDPFSNCRD